MIDLEKTIREYIREQVEKYMEEHLAEQIYEYSELNWDSSDINNIIHEWIEKNTSHYNYLILEEIVKEYLDGLLK